MKTVIAVCYPELENYLSGIEVLDIVEYAYSRESLMEICKSISAGIVIISGKLSGNITMEELISEIAATNNHVIFLYGEEDEKTDCFCELLKENGIYDYHIGLNLNASDLEKMIFSAVIRNSSSLGVSGDREAKKSWMLSSVFSSELKKRHKYSIEANNVCMFMEHMVIAIYSAHVTGKSHTAWNLSSCIAGFGYETSVINMDEGFSANIFFGIDDIYDGLLDYTLEREDYRNILSNCCKRGRLNIISGKMGDALSIKTEQYMKLLNHIRFKSDITIVDTRRELNDITLSSIRSSTLDILVLDCDLMHFNANLQLLSRLGDDFVAEKTIAVINNCDKSSEAYKYIFNQLKRKGYDFKAILPLSSCGSVSQELMCTDKTPYLVSCSKTKSFIHDMDMLLKVIGLKEKRRLYTSKNSRCLY
ncbi:MAG: MinD/ParA family ATP-binding protein [Bacillota bacterium]